MDDLKFTVGKKMKAILPMIVLNIILPTIDVITDLSLAYLLCNTGYRCKHGAKYAEDVWKCLMGSNEDYCTHEDANMEVCDYWDSEGWVCIDPDEDYQNCQFRSGPDLYCTSVGKNKDVCNYGHPIYAGSLFCVFLLNYSLSWITWFRLDSNKKCSFLFPLLNCYPQFGKYLLFCQNIIM